MAALVSLVDTLGNDEIAINQAMKIIKQSTPEMPSDLYWD